MPKRKKKRSSLNKLERWEIALVKRMIISAKGNDQDILAYFTRPSRSINHARISEIRTGAKHAAVQPATQEQLEEYLSHWPEIDPISGTHIRDDELLIKAREAMLHAVQGYNNPRSYFKSESFIVLAIIAFTYLLHWHYKRNNVDIRYKKKSNGKPDVIKTKHGADKHWELEECVKQKICPLDEPTINNLRFLIEIRHEIEHQLTNRIDDTISAKLQACCLNFNRVIKDLAGVRSGLDGELGLALQFTSIDRDQRNILLQETALPANVKAAHIEFENALSDEMVADSRYAYRVAYIEQSVNSRGKADQVVEFIKSDSERGEQLRLLLKEIERPKYKPRQIVDMMHDEGYEKFNMHHHTQLWKNERAREQGKNYGTLVAGGEWYWYPNWVDKVREHVKSHRDRYV
ncbi:DUF3644 domain-containing protein [Marinivivus vitaminiproducens]|uniref:DUF3644 domain-containing protein n=1 Tax=Marinivivus vitaminiproducens TaxID=3035935 RepID=UPI00279BA13A|nr:DUF3644 domain-containing protein [Geminicoccaceae bacterium SCSIO 64248]